MKINDNVVYLDKTGGFLYYTGVGICQYTGNSYHKFVQGHEYGDAYHYGYISDTEMVEWAFIFPMELGLG